MPGLNSISDYGAAAAIAGLLGLAGGKELVVATSGITIALSTYYSCRKAWESVIHPHQMVYNSFFSFRKCVPISTLSGTLLGIVGGDALYGTLVGCGICISLTALTHAIAVSKKILHRPA